MLEKFIAEYSEKGYQFAYRLCGNVEDAKELVQETFVRVMRKWDHYDSTQPLEGYFQAVLRNLYYDGLKRYERRNCCSIDAVLSDVPPEDEDRAPGLADRIADGEPALLERLEREESARHVQAAFESLRPEHRAILSLSDVEGLSYERIAAVLDCPLGTVRSRLNRARRALKERLLQSSEVMNP